MAIFLLGGLGFMLAPQRKERTLRIPDDFSLSNFLDEEFRSQYHFGGKSKEFLYELLRNDLKRNTSWDHAFLTTYAACFRKDFFLVFCLVISTTVLMVFTSTTVLSVRMITESLAYQRTSVLTTLLEQAWMTCVPTY